MSSVVLYELFRRGGKKHYNLFIIFFKIKNTILFILRRDTTF